MEALPGTRLLAVARLWDKCLVAVHVHRCGDDAARHLRAVVGQVRLLLKDLCGTGQFTYRRINPAAILSSSNSMLVQCCMERISQDSQTIPREHVDAQDGEEYLQLVTITDTAEIHQDRDKGTYSPSPSSAAYAASAAASVVSCF